MENKLPTLPTQYFCPSCNCNLTAKVIVKYKEVWKAGDVTICQECLCLLRFDDAMQLRIYDKKDMRKLAPELKQIAKAWQTVSALLQVLKKKL